MKGMQEIQLEVTASSDLQMVQETRPHWGIVLTSYTGTQMSQESRPEFII